MSYVIRSIPQCDDCGHEWLPRSDTKRCPNRECRSINWNRTATPLKPQLEASLAITPAIPELPIAEKMKIAVAAMESVGRAEAIQSTPLQTVIPANRCNQRDQDSSGDWYRCVLPKGHKAKHVPSDTPEEI